MGTDVHAVFQKRVNGTWQDVPSEWEQDRHYFLFSWLADVRNGFGFAGVKTYSRVEPIDEPRGIPEDFAMEDCYHYALLESLNEQERKWHADEVDPEGGVRLFMGDHSYSWLTLDEILAAARPDLAARSPVEVEADSTHVQIYWKAVGNAELECLAQGFG